MKFVTRYLGIFICVIAIASASFPLFGRGFIPTHDGEYHIVRFSEFYSMLQQGYLFPRWAPNLNSGFGVPLFIFHYPFPNYVGSFFHLLGAPFVESFKYSLAFGYAIAVIASFFWIKKIFGTFAGAVAGITFAYIPYWFVELYVRGSIGEVFALAWIMLALSCIEYTKPLLLTLSIALAILSHNILAMIVLPIVVVYTIIRQRSYLWAIVRGVVLSAYFWLPAIVEQRYVTGLNIVNFKDHFPMIHQLLFPSWGTGFSVKEMTPSEMSFQIGIVSMVVIGLSVVFRNKIPKHLKSTGMLFIVITIMGLYLMLEYSLWIWEKLPIIQFIQYPWRFLAWYLPVVAFFSGFVASRINKWVAAGLCAMAVLVSYQYTRPVIYQPRSDAYYLTRLEFIDGTSSMGNTFSTRWTPWKEKRAKQKIEFVSGKGIITTTKIKPLQYVFTVQADEDAYMRVNTLYYPGWTVRIDHGTKNVAYERDGVIAFDLLKGTHVVSVEFRDTPARKIANCLSLAGLLWFLVSGILKGIYARSHRRIAPFKRT